MADDKKKKKEYFASPKGVAKYAHLNKPQTTINDKPVKPTYTVTVLLDPEDAATIALVEKIQAAHAKGYAEAKAANPKKKYTDMGIENMIKPDTDKDGAPTGKTAVKFKASAEGTRRDKSIWTFKPALLDARGQGLPADAVVFGGSVIQASYTINHNAMETGSFYTSLGLQAVMVHVLKGAYEKSASEYGFAVEAEDSQDAFGEQNGAEGGANASAPTDF